MARKAKQTHETEKHQFATRLREIMKERGTTQETLAKAIGVKRQTVSLYTTGQSKPDCDGVRAIAKFFEVSADYLLGLAKDPSPDYNISVICKYTGLSSQAVEKLNKFSENAENMDMLSRMIVNEYCGLLLYQMRLDCEWSSNKEEDRKRFFNSLRLETESTLDDVPLGDREGVIKKLQERYDNFRANLAINTDFAAVQAFSKLLGNIREDGE